MEIWDGYYRDGSLSGTDLIRGREIPKGQFHLVCEVLVRHVDGDYLLMQRDLSKPNYPGYYEATAGGSALKGEDKITCIKRELYEETGIQAEEFEEIGCIISEESQCIFYSFLCVTDWNKEDIKLQKGETMSFKWVNESEFKRFIHSSEMIETQKKRYMPYLKKCSIVPGGQL